MSGRNTYGSVDGPAVPGLTLLKVLGRGGSAVVYLARQDELDRLVASALSKHRADRPLSAGAFAAAFKAIAEGEPALAWRSRQAFETKLGTIRQRACSGGSIFSPLACLGVAALSYADNLAVSINADAAVTDLDVLASGIERGFAEL